MSPPARLLALGLLFFLLGFATFAAHTCAPLPTCPPCPCAELAPSSSSADTSPSADRVTP